MQYTIAREIISIPIYFTTFYYLNEKFKTEKYNSQWYANSFISGGIAGVNSWLITYPIDTLKSRKQLFPAKTFHELYKIGNLFNGLLITLTRAFVVNGFSFYMYDNLAK